MDSAAFDWKKVEQDDCVRLERAAGLLATMLTPGGPTEPSLVK